LVFLVNWVLKKPLGRRLFVGVFPPADVRAALEGALPPGWDETVGLKVVPPHQWHVTLCFLGETREERLGPLITFLAEASGGTPPFPTDLEGIGAFPRLGNPKALFVRASDPAGAWAASAEKVREGLRLLGFAPGEKPFLPHLTLARVVDDKAGAPTAGDWSARLKGFSANWRVGGFELVESRLGPSGPSYGILGTYPFGA
jgi:2'-5' RNA ligase